MKYVLDTNTLSFAMAGDLSVCRRMLSQARTNVLLPQPVVAIASHALAIDATLVSEDITHMRRIPGLRVENWRTSRAGPPSSP